MEIRLFDKEDKAKVVDEIKKYFNGEIDKLDVTNITPTCMIKCIEDAGGIVDTDSMDTNGWQLDYWMKVKYNDKKFTLFGVAYYGHARLYVGEDDY